MASNKSSNSNKIMVPQARAAMNKFKMEAGQRGGVDLKKGYNGSLTTKEAGSGRPDGEEDDPVLRAGDVSQE